MPRDISRSGQIAWSGGLFIGSHALYIFFGGVCFNLNAMARRLGSLNRFAVNASFAAESFKTLMPCAIVTVMLPRIVATAAVIGLGVLLVMLSLTTPATAGPFGLLAIFVSAYLFFLGVVSFFLFGVRKLVIMVSRSFAVRRPPRELSFRRSYYYGTVLAVAPVLVIGLQSVGTVGIYEAMLILLFRDCLACVYVSSH